ncbi:amino acid permease [Allofrancisella guangzhouensis]|uniref:Amino acid transporter n=1 Tax=Allofrancisella guangzhouensis TaxID=594679 RepID=A0A0A8E661_9GAMM|nr:APC family permease [Allofrancisella guangzhouensis]AJC49459.1 amino acid transporter [Allofrancisella guangzhouensis]MBK2026754.1 amino acid permease [Allofrancisella guangzhouensis]MBK2044259.1 amino acid permease [Allofrancisella guangzhouensis]MBK2046166.1 amino acid permease [Allofrancisella guangzhouensis]
MGLAPSDSNKVLGFKDVTIMAVTANFGIRWIPVAACLGASAVFFWILGALIFFLPLVVIAVQLSRKYPDEGGMYAWTTRALGEKSGFMVAWLYWVNTIFYYPAVLMFLATNFAYFIGRPELVDNNYYIVIVVLSAFWLVTFVSFYGLKVNKYLVDVGGILGSFIPAIAIIVLGFAAYFVTGKSATDFSAFNFIPQGSTWGNLSTLTIIMFAMAGIEIIPTFANSVRNVKRNLYYGLLASAFILLGLYILGTVALNLVSSPDSINGTSGLMAAFEIIGHRFEWAWFPKLMAFLLTFAELAAVSIWLLAPVVMFFKCTPRGILPEWLHKTNKHDSPKNALVAMGVLVTVIVLLTSFLPSVNVMYQALILMATILYFIPYLYLVVAYIKLMSSKFRYLLGFLVFISTTLGILFSFQPPSDIQTLSEILIYELELVIGPTIFILIGWALYKFRK